MGEEEKKPEEQPKAEEKKPEEEKKKEEAAAAEKPSEEKKPEQESKEEVAAPPPPPPPAEIVLKVFMHCEGCARKVRRSLKGFPGVDDVVTDCKSHKVVVKGEEGPRGRKAQAHTRREERRDCDDGSESWHALRSLRPGNQETHTENEGSGISRTRSAELTSEREGGVRSSKVG